MALTVYVNGCLKCEIYTHITENLVEKLINVDVPKFAELTNLKIKNMSNLEDYFYKKVDIRKKLGLSENLI